jgi:hypothetical protein
MAATLDQISSYLEKLGWVHEIDEEECRILTGVYTENREMKMENFLRYSRLKF